MASNSGVQQQIQQQQQHFQQQNNSPYHCKECGLSLNSAESLEVHLQYHKENLLKHWAIQAASSHSEETNNNTPKANMKRELIPNNTIATADSSDSIQKKSPEYSRATPESIFGHPPTPQSYQSASSPYQNHDNSNFSPNFSNYQQKNDRTSPNPQQQQQQQPQYQQNNYPNYSDPQYFPMESSQNQQYPDSYAHNKNNPMQNSSYRYHPYSEPQQNNYERQQTQAQVSTSSPAYPPQPTPSPSPKQCDKCGYVCESASQLIEHLNMAHPPTPAPHLSAYQPNQHFMFDQPPIVKQEDNGQSEILDLDSHKVVHNVFPEEEKHQNGDPIVHNPHSVSALLNSWSPAQQSPQQPQQKMFPQHPAQEQRIFMNAPDQMHNQDFIVNGVTTTSQENAGSNMNALGQPHQSYRPFEHLTSPPNAPVISSTQVPNSPAQPPPTMQKNSANWKSNEARRPKTYNCTACNKWFTSSGHLKRHYNTTLHKNAVKSSGQPDPATMPISAHHHPARDSSSKQDDRPQSGSSGDEIRSEDNSSMPPHPYDRPPNGEAGLSTTNVDSRGLLSLSSPPINTANTHGFNMAPQHMMSMDNNQFQMYPNESAPHVTQAMDTNSHNTTGEFQFTSQNSLAEENQPLPSFAQIQAHRYGLIGYDIANVGGGGAVTTPYTYYTEPSDVSESKPLMYRSEEDDYKLTVLTAADPPPMQTDYMVQYSPNHNNNNNHSDDHLGLMSLNAQPKSPEKAHIKRDYEENTGSPLISSTVLTKSGLHKCYDCDKIFNKACYLTQHNKTFHSGDKPFKCSRCGKRFSCEVTYQEHLTKHAGDKPHKCDLCPKQFNHKTDLRRHMCLHTGQKPYACDTCGKGFIRKDHMMKHCETHVRKTQSKLASLR
ncbi:transcription factor 20-like [Anoplophora glabripennis]|uniref:transcription factor 20-like n=1 Tax=Anoplophora glabripennis TaxID=217634 RepID=UPI0008752167|nr:transcription factor 20-like [Anoplophora glabripennis]